MNGLNIDNAKNINEILAFINFGCDNRDIKDVTYVRERIEQMTRAEVLKNHPYKITHSKDGYWRTYVKDSSKKTGCRLIKKKTEESLKEELVKIYKTQNPQNKPTFKDVYFSWRNVQDELVSGNTVYKYNTDYQRFLKNTSFEQKQIDKISEDDIKLFFHDAIVSNKLSKGAFKKLYGYVNSTFAKASREKIITENPMNVFVCKQFYVYCDEIEKPIEKQIFSEEEVMLITKKLHEEYITQPRYIPNYAVEFASLTGMRVGEIVALKWENIFFDKGYFLINCSEKYDRTTKRYNIDKTKNKKSRKFPIDTAIKQFLLNMKKVQLKYGFSSEWVFANEEGRLHAPVVSSCIKNKCKQLNIPPKGIHAFRKTFNSNMRCSGVSDVVAAALLGHSVQVNRMYYTFDTSSLEDKREIVTSVHVRMA